MVLLWVNEVGLGDGVGSGDGEGVGAGVTAVEYKDT